jgi:predicted nucleic acid-binding protein
MNGRFLLDTNIILDYLKGDAIITSFLIENAQATLCISVITRMELFSFHGITSAEEIQIRQAISPIAITPINDSIEEIVVRFRRATRRSLPDSIIAASAIFYDAMLLTRDRVLINTNYPGLHILTYLQDRKHLFFFITILVTTL